MTTDIICFLSIKVEQIVAKQKRLVAIYAQSNLRRFV